MARNPDSIDSRLLRCALQPPQERCLPAHSPTRDSLSVAKLACEGSGLQGEAYVTRNHKDAVTNTRTSTSRNRRKGDLHRADRVHSALTAASCTETLFTSRSGMCPMRFPPSLVLVALYHRSARRLPVALLLMPTTTAKGVVSQESGSPRQGGFTAIAKKLHLTGMYLCRKAVTRTLMWTQRAPIRPPTAPIAQKIGTSQT